MNEAAPSERHPLGWLIFFGREHDGQPRESWIPNRPPHDLAYALQKAVDLRGVLVTAIVEP